MSLIVASDENEALDASIMILSYLKNIGEDFTNDLDHYDSTKTYVLMVNYENIQIVLTFFLLKNHRDYYIVIYKDKSINNFFDKLNLLIDRRLYGKYELTWRFLGETLKHIYVSKNDNELLDDLRRYISSNRGILNVPTEDNFQGYKHHLCNFFLIYDFFS